MKTALAIVLCVGFAATTAAQNLVLKDGRTIAAKSMRRQGNQIIVSQEVQLAPGKPTTVAEVGYTLAQIEKLDFPEPAALARAEDFLTKGKPEDALAALEPVIRYYEGFRDAPGSWWADSAMLKLNALVAMGNDREAAPLIDQLARFANDPEIVRAAAVQRAAGMTRAGRFTDALPMFEDAVKEAKRPDTLATAAVYMGRCHLALKAPEKALLSFLEVPVFYPDQRSYLPASMLGTGRAYFAMEDFARAKAALNDLVKTFVGTKEADEAKAELEAIEKREKALAPPA
jgi:TolA-binding protein